jgi:hypothetical protein
MKKLLVFLAVASFVFLGILALANPPGPGYHLIKNIPLGASPGGGEYFDYVTVDAASRRVYASHGTEVKVLDADNYSLSRWCQRLARDLSPTEMARAW